MKPTQAEIDESVAGARDLLAAADPMERHQASLRARRTAGVVASLADQLADAQTAVRAANESLSRLTTIVDEAFGMQPVMSTENLLTFLERSLYERRVAAEDAQRNAAQAVARVRELEGEREEATALLVEWTEAYSRGGLYRDTRDFLDRLTTSAAGRDAP